MVIALIQQELIKNLGEKTMYVLHPVRPYQSWQHFKDVSAIKMPLGEVKLGEFREINELIFLFRTLALS